MLLAWGRRQRREAEDRFQLAYEGEYARIRSNIVVRHQGSIHGLIFTHKNGPIFLTASKPSIGPATSSFMPMCCRNGRCNGEPLGLRLPIVAAVPDLGEHVREGDQPSMSTMSNVTIRESGSKSEVGGLGVTISASGRRADCSQRSLALYGSPSKYICVTMRFTRPVTSK
jgi:hypothetical protein